MTLAEIEERLHEAITTLAALPDRERRFLKAKMASWPETLREAADVWEQGIARVRQGKAAFEAMRAPHSVPSPDAIDRMDEAIRWLAWISDRDRKIVTLRAFGLSWARIAWRFDRRGGNGHVSDETVRRWNAKALEILKQKLTEQRAA